MMRLTSSKPSLWTLRFHENERRKACKCLEASRNGVKSSPAGVSPGGEVIPTNRAQAPDQGMSSVRLERAAACEGPGAQHEPWMRRRRLTLARAS
jgi:hypothetical protein